MSISDAPVPKIGSTPRMHTTAYNITAHTRNGFYGEGLRGYGSLRFFCTDN